MRFWLALRGIQCADVHDQVPLAIPASLLHGLGMSDPPQYPSRLVSGQIGGRPAGQQLTQ